MAVLEEEVLSPLLKCSWIYQCAVWPKNLWETVDPSTIKAIVLHTSHTLKTSVPLITFSQDNFIYTVIRYFADPEFSLRKSEITLKLHISWLNQVQYLYCNIYLYIFLAFMTQQEYKHNYQHPSSINRQMDPNQSRCGLCDCILFCVWIQALCLLCI